MKNTGIAYHAVANFLGTIDQSLPKEFHMMNMMHDAWMYGWNWQTTQAMVHGLNELYSQEEVAQ